MSWASIANAAWLLIMVALVVAFQLWQVSRIERGSPEGGASAEPR